MKKSILTVTGLFLLVGLLLTNCSTPAEKVANAENKVIKANKELAEATSKQQAELEVYRRETAAKISANNESIAAFNARIASEKQEAREAYRKKVSELEQKNTDMKKRLDDYKADGKDNWEKFKIEFSHDMDEIGKALKALTVNNVD